MNKYDLDFENIFEYLDIHSFDLDYLKSFGTDEEKNLYLQSDAKTDMIIRGMNNRIEELNNEILSLTNKLNDKRIDFEAKNLIIEEIQNLNEKVDQIQDDIQKHSINSNSDTKKTNHDVSELNDKYEILKIRGIDILKEKLTPSKMKEMNREELEKLLAIKSILTKTKSLEKYIKDRQMILENVDIKNRDLGFCEYKQLNLTCNNSYTRKFYFRYKMNNVVNIRNLKRMPKFKYSILIGHKNENKKWIIEPERLFKSQIHESDMQVYDFGNFMYQYTPQRNGRYLYTNDVNRLIGVIRRDEEGNLVTYHGIMYINDKAPDFYIDIAFSNIMLRNAIKNNSGFIGYIEKDNKPDSKYGYKLVFEENKILDLNNVNDVTAISYAMFNDGECNISKRNLSEVFEYIDQILRQKVNAILRNKF